MTTVAIHYQSPASDPHKIPRPHYYTLDGSPNDANPECAGGELGPVRLLGYCMTQKPNVDDWAMAGPDEVGDPGYVPTELRGFYAQFIDIASGGMFGYAVPIERVEVSE
jgi:hypothetical protein